MLLSVCLSMSLMSTATLPACLDLGPRPRAARLVIWHAIICIFLWWGKLAEASMANLGNLCLSEAWSCQCRCRFHCIAVLLYLISLTKLFFPQDSRGVMLSLNAEKYLWQVAFFFLQVVGQRHLERHKPRWSSRAGCGSHVWACFSGSITTRNAGDVQTLVMIKPNYIKLWSLSMSACPWCLIETFYTLIKDLIWVSSWRDDFGTRE